MVAVNQQGALSGLARAMVQKKILPEADAESIQSQANGAGIGFVEQLIAGKKLTENQVAEFASEVFGLPLLDLDAMEVEQLPNKLVDEKIIVTRKVLPLFQRGNRLFVGLSDPTSRATLDELESLPGIGAVLAQRVIDHRRSVGRFQAVESLREVKGIGATKFEQIKFLVTVARGKTEKQPS